MDKAGELNLKCGLSLEGYRTVLSVRLDIG